MTSEKDTEEADGMRYEIWKRCIPVELLQQRERRARLPAAQQYRAILADVTGRTRVVLPHPHASKRTGLSHASRMALDPFDPVSRTHAHAHGAHTVYVMPRAGDRVHNR